MKQGGEKDDPSKRSTLALTAPVRDYLHVMFPGSHRNNVRSICNSVFYNRYTKRKELNHSTIICTCKDIEIRKKLPSAQKINEFRNMIHVYELKRKVGDTNVILVKKLWDKGIHCLHR